MLSPFYVKNPSLSNPNMTKNNNNNVADIDDDIDYDSYNANRISTQQQQQQQAQLSRRTTIGGFEGGRGGWESSSSSSYFSNSSSGSGSSSSGNRYNNNNLYPNTRPSPGFGTAVSTSTPSGAPRSSRNLSSSENNFTMGGGGVANMQQQLQQLPNLTGRVHIALIGDSDVDRWPKQLLPVLGSAEPDGRVTLAEGNAKTIIEQLVGTTTTTRSNADRNQNNVPVDNSIKPTTTSNNGMMMDAPDVTWSVSGHPGAMLQEILPHVETVLRQREQAMLRRHAPSTIGLQQQQDRQSPSIAQRRSSAPASASMSSGYIGPHHLILVICAGENDAASGIPIWETKKAFRELLRILESASRKQLRHEKIGVIFLGPKFEPWQNDDDTANRKLYVQMSKCFEKCSCAITASANGSFFNSSSQLAPDATQASHLHDSPDYSDLPHEPAVVSSRSNSNSPPKTTAISFDFLFIDCLAMFCGETGMQPGAILGGKARAEERYFCKDQLHLNDAGYQVWKQVVEEAIEQLLQSGEI